MLSWCEEHRALPWRKKKGKHFQECILWKREKIFFFPGVGKKYFSAEGREKKPSMKKGKAAFPERRWKVRFHEGKGKISLTWQKGKCAYLKEGKKEPILKQRRRNFTEANVNRVWEQWRNILKMKGAAERWKCIYVCHRVKRNPEILIYDSTCVSSNKSWGGGKGVYIWYVKVELVSSMYITN